MTGTALIGLGMVSSVYVDALNRLSVKLELRGVLASSAKSQDAFLEKHAAALPDAPGCVHRRKVDPLSFVDRPL